MAATTQEVQERIAALGPWFYEFDLGAHGRTASVLPPEILPIHQTRLEMVNRVVVHRCRLSRGFLFRSHGAQRHA